MIVPQAPYLVLLGLAVSGSGMCGEEKSSRPKNAPANALASCVVTSHSCRSPTNYTSKKGQHQLELVFNHQPNLFLDYWHNFVSAGHYKSTYWAVSEDHYFAIPSTKEPAKLRDLVEELLNEHAGHCNAEVECQSVENSDEDGLPKSSDNDDAK